MTDTNGLHVWRAKARVGTRLLYDNISFDVDPGEILSIVGYSGWGKSTLLRFIAGVLDPSVVADGEIHLAGRRIDMLRPESRAVGIVFQSAALFPHMTVSENLLFSLRGMSDRKDRLKSALSEIGLENVSDAYPATLSGGEQARVALMRALLAQPRALLLDEPFSSLDASLRGEVRRLTFDLVRSRAIPTLLVTHDTEDANSAAGRVIHLASGGDHSVVDDFGTISGLAP